MIYAFEVKVPRLGGGGSIINHRTRGGAMAEYLSQVRDAWPDVQYTDLRARKLGPAQSSAAFLRVASRRGLPDLRCGQRVVYRDGDEAAPGYVVGHNDSDNFEVLFDADSRFKGMVCNVHPHDLDLCTEGAAA